MNRPMDTSRASVEPLLGWYERRRDDMRIYAETADMLRSLMVENEALQQQVEYLRAVNG
jgi:hypothetical protein